MQNQVKSSRKEIRKNNVKAFHRKIFLDCQHSLTAFGFQDTTMRLRSKYNSNSFARSHTFELNKSLKE